MGKLPMLICPDCNAEMVEIESIVKLSKTTKFEDCLRRCKRCGIGASNTATSKAVTYIYCDPIQNIPAESRDGANEALRDALNEFNRVSKRRRFGFSTSEDAVTWVVFSHLLRDGGLVPALERSGIINSDKVTNPPAVLLWGSPLDGNIRGIEIKNKLIELCNSLGEKTRRRSEPDVIIDFGGEGLIFIEVKYRSGNERKRSDYPHWCRYISAAGLEWRVEDVKASECYELARNWCFLKCLAGKRPATLVNLGSANLFSGKAGARLDRFVTALGSDRRYFKTLTWHDLLGAEYTTDWFGQFCRDRGLNRVSR